MGTLHMFPDPLTRAALSYDRETTEIARAASVEWCAAALRVALGRGIYTEIADARCELTQAWERLGL